MTRFGSWTRRELATLCAASALVALAFAFAFHEAAVNRRSESARPAPNQEMHASANSAQGHEIGPEAFNRVLIRNIGSVPFEEIFDLLRSASPQVRTAWIQQLSNMPRGPQRVAAIASFYKTYVQLDPRGAADSLKLLNDPDTLALAVNSMVEAAPISAMPIMAEMLINVPRKKFGLLDPAYGVIGSWSLVDPLAAAQFVEAHPTFPVQTLFSSWAGQDPETALDWFLRRPKDDDGLEWLNNVHALVDSWYDKDKTGAVAFAVSHGNEDDYDDAPKTIAARLFRDSADEARDFVLRLTGNARIGAVASIAQLSAPAGRFDPETDRPSPRTIADWVSACPWNARSNRSAPCYMTGRRTNLPKRSLGLTICRQVPRDRTIIAFVSTVHSDEALKLAISLSDPSLREATLTDYMQSWLHTSRADAIEILNSKDLSDAQKNYLTRFLPKQ